MTDVQAICVAVVVCMLIWCITADLERLRAEIGLLDIAEAHARLRERLERLRPLSERDDATAWKAMADARLAERDAARAEVERLTQDAEQHRLTVMGWDEDVRHAIAERDAAIRDRNEIAAMLEELKP